MGPESWHLDIWKCVSTYFIYSVTRVVYFFTCAELKSIPTYNVFTRPDIIWGTTYRPWLWTTSNYRHINGLLVLRTVPYFIVTGTKVQSTQLSVIIGNHHEPLRSKVRTYTLSLVRSWSGPTRELWVPIRIASRKSRILLSWTGCAYSDRLLVSCPPPLIQSFDQIVFMLDNICLYFPRIENVRTLRLQKRLARSKLNRKCKVLLPVSF